MKKAFTSRKMILPLIGGILGLLFGAVALIFFLQAPSENGDAATLTRGQWAEMLGARFGYTQSHQAEPFYEDISADHTLFATVQALKEDGVLQYEATFAEETPISFDEMLSHAVALYGEEYLSNRTDKADPTEADLKEYIRKSVPLSAQYEDSALLTVEQASAWLEQLHAAWLDREFGNSFVSSPKEGVRDRLTEQNYILTDNTLILESETPPQAGEILLLGATQEYPNGVARKVEAVTGQEGTRYTLTVSTPEIEEIFEDFSLEFSQTPAESDFLPAEGVTVTESEEGDLLFSINPSLLGGEGQILPLSGFSETKSGVFFDRSLRFSSETWPFGTQTPLTQNPDFPAGTSFNGSDGIADGIFLDQNNQKKSKFDAGFELECGLKLSNFNLRGSLDWNGLIYASEFNVSLSMDVTPYFRLRGNAQETFRLGSIPLQLGYGFTARIDLYLVLSVNGEVSVEPTIHCNGSVRKAQASYLPRASASATCDTEISVSADLGVQIGPDVTLSYLDVAQFADAYLLVGVGASAKWDSSAPESLSVELYLPTLHIGIGMNENTLLSVLLDTFGDARHDWAILDNNGGTRDCPVTLTRVYQIVRIEPLDWSFENGVLTVSGTIPDYMGENAGEVMPPWFRATQADPGTEDEPNPVNVEIKKLVVSEGVTRIGAGAFSALSGLEEVVLPSTLLSVGENAFSGCESLKAVTLPEGVFEIGADAFSECSALESVSLPDSLKSLGIRAFSGCTGLKSVSFGEGSIVIGREAFADCVSLEEVILPEGLTRVPMKAFYDCTALKKVTLPATVTQIGMLAFGNCRALTECNRDGVTLAEEGAFYNCVGLGEYDYGNQEVWADRYADRVSLSYADEIE